MADHTLFYYFFFYQMRKKKCLKKSKKDENEEKKWLSFCWKINRVETFKKKKRLFYICVYVFGMEYGFEQILTMKIYLSAKNDKFKSKF